MDPSRLERGSHQEQTDLEGLDSGWKLISGLDEWGELERVHKEQTLIKGHNALV